MRSRRRIAKLIAKRLAEREAKFTGFRQADGSVKYIRQEQVPEVCSDALQGRDTPATRALLCSVGATDGSSLHQLLQALHRPGYVAVTSGVIQ